MADDNSGYSDLNQQALRAALAHIASGGSLSVQGAPPGPNGAPSGPPNIQLGAPAPPPPPPPMNFTDFATRPENGMKVQGALSTQPNQPTPFNHPPTPPLSVFNPSPNLLPLNTLAPATPPPFTPQQPADTAPPMPGNAGAPTPAAPNLPAPAYNVQPGMMTQDEFFQAHPELAAHPQAQTPLGKALLFVTAGLSGAAGGLHGDPLAGVRYAQGVADYNRSVPEVNQARYEAGVVKPYQQILQNEDTRSQIQQRGASAALDDAKRLQIPLKDQQELAQHGLMRVTDPTTGETSTVVDPDSPVTKRQQAQTDFIQSHQELEEAQAALAKVRADPNSPQYQLARQRLAIAAKNASTAAGRLGLSSEIYKMHAFGTDGQGNALPGSLLLDDGTPIGTANASNVRPTATQRDAAGRATTMDALSQRLQAGLQDPEIQAHLGPLAGRAAEMQSKLGNLPPKVAEFYNDLKSYGAFQAGLHPVRGIGALNYFDEVMGGLHQTPEALAAKLASNTGTGDSVQNVGNPRIAGGKAQQSPRKVSPLSGNSGGGKQLTPDAAQQYLAKAGGDKNKARALAKADGYSF